METDFKEHIDCLLAVHQDKNIILILFKPTPELNKWVRTLIGSR